MSTSHSEAFLRLVAEAKALIQEVSPREARTLIAQGAGLIDVREPEEFAAGHLLGTTRLDRLHICSQIEALHFAPDQPIVIYCASGNRSSLAALQLQQIGYSQVVSLRGGIKAYEATAETTLV